MLMLNWFSCACIVQGGCAGSFYVNTTISLAPFLPTTSHLRGEKNIWMLQEANTSELA